MAGMQREFLRRDCAGAASGETKRKEKAYAEYIESAEYTESAEFTEKRKAGEGSLDYAARRAKLRRGRKNRTAPLGMTVPEVAEGTESLGEV